MNSLVTILGEPNFNFWSNVIFTWYFTYISLWVKKPIVQFMATEFLKSLYIMQLELTSEPVSRPEWKL